MVLAVVVNDPWPTPYLFIPDGSTVRMSCRADSTSPSFFWSIDLASDPSHVQFQFTTRGGMTLNADGVYQLPEETTSANITTLVLLINNTAINNGTIIHCSRGTLSSMSTLLAFSKSTIIPMMVIIIEMHALQLKSPLSSSLRCSNSKKNRLTSHGVKNQPLRLMHHVNYSHLKSTMVQTFELFR